MGTYTHWLRPSRPVPVPEQVIVLSVALKLSSGRRLPRETWYELRCWVAAALTLQDGVVVDREEWRSQRSDVFWDRIWDFTCKGGNTWVFAHSVVLSMTMLNLWQVLDSADVVTTHFVTNDPPTVLRLRLGKKRITIVDIANYIPTAGRQWSSDEISLTTPSRCSESSTYEWFESCAAGVSTLERVVTALLGVVSSTDWGGLRTTASSLAWAAFRAQMEPRSILVHDDPEVLALERASYYGGLCESWYTGTVETGVRVMDINSLYPYVMCEADYPTRLLCLIRAPAVARAQQLIKGYAGVAECSLATYDDAYPKRHGGRTLLCRGRYATVLAGATLSHCLDHGCVRAVSRLALYEAKPIFHCMCTRILHLRLRALQAGDQASAALYKMMMVGLYGKWAQRKLRWADTTDLDPPCAHGWGWFRCPGWDRVYWTRWLGYKAQRHVREGDAENSCPVISACIAAAGREHLLDLRRIAGERHVYYSDTDSLHCDEEGYHALGARGMVDELAPGKARLAGWYDRASYNGWKNYTVGSKRVLAGVSTRAVAGAAGTLQEHRVERLASVLSRPGRGVVRVQLVQSPVPDVRPRGQYGEDGWMIPYLIGGEHDHGGTEDDLRGLSPGRKPE